MSGPKQHVVDDGSCHVRDMIEYGRRPASGHLHLPGRWRRGGPGDLGARHHAHQRHHPAQLKSSPKLRTGEEQGPPSRSAY